MDRRMGKRTVIVNDKLQKGYRYRITGRAFYRRVGASEILRAQPGANTQGSGSHRQSILSSWRRERDSNHESASPYPFENSR